MSQVHIIQNGRWCQWQIPCKFSSETLYPPYFLLQVAEETGNATHVLRICCTGTKLISKYSLNTKGGSKNEKIQGLQYLGLSRFLHELVAKVDNSTSGLAHNDGMSSHNTTGGNWGNRTMAKARREGLADLSQK